MKQEHLGFRSLMHEQTEWPAEKIALEDLHVIADRYLRVLPLCAKSDVLELGAGSSIGKTELSQTVASYISIDISSENILRTRDFCQRHELLQCQGDASRLPFRADSFDVVIALAMIYYLDPGKLLKEVAHVLRPGGKLFFCTSNKEVPGFVPAPGSREYLNTYEWNKLLGAHGFTSKFEGVFEKKHVIPLGPRAKLISFSKRILAKTGFGWIWSLLRGLVKGPSYKIPSELEKFPEHNYKRVELDPNSTNDVHRVIYCECKLLAAK